MDNTLSSFKPGARVEYVGTAKPENIGREATVVRPVKSRKVVTIKWADTGQWYDAFPASLAIK